ncbi:hypothetical protein GCM10010466_46230 [Planomonospora alba]|uniref:Uncharacterized protein n=1 Tax=Planomonospora alba TaxID=161354 RepID=A0ABP6NJ70_9ACTN
MTLSAWFAGLARERLGTDRRSRAALAEAIARDRAADPEGDARMTAELRRMREARPAARRKAAEVRSRNRPWPRVGRHRAARACRSGTRKGPGTTVVVPGPFPGGAAGGRDPVSA